MKTKQYEISVVIPLYNVEQYVEKLVSSIQNQDIDFDFFNVLFVDDGCTDKTIEVLKNNLQATTFNYQILTKENGGLSDARNYGIKQANSKYICFIDSDDWVENSYLKELYNEMQKSDYDYVMCETNWIYPNYTKLAQIKEGKDCIETMFKSSIAAWNKMYKKEIFDKYLFTKGLLFEDLDLILQITPEFNKIGFVHKPLYNYVQQRKDSILNIKSDKDIKSYDYIFNNFYNAYKDSEYYQYLECYFIRRIVFSTLNKYLNSNYQDQAINLYLKYNEMFKNWNLNDEISQSPFMNQVWGYLVIRKQWWLLKIVKKLK